MEKTLPKVGDKLYLRQFTGNGYVDEVKTPYTVIDVTSTRIKVQACTLIAPIYHGDYAGVPSRLEGQRIFFYDTVAESIEENPNGRIKELTWHGRKSLWGTSGPDSDYPQYAIFGKWEHAPYLN